MSPQPKKVFTRSGFLRVTAGTVAAAAAMGSLSSSASVAQSEAATSSLAAAPGSGSGADIDSLLGELDEKVKAGMQKYGIPGVALGLLH